MARARCLPRAADVRWCFVGRLGSAAAWWQAAPGPPRHGRALARSTGDAPCRRRLRRSAGAAGHDRFKRLLLLTVNAIAVASDTGRTRSAAWRVVMSLSDVAWLGSIFARVATARSS